MPADFHYQIIQLGYSKFFNAEDDSTWCNDRTFGKIPFTISPPKLTLELRRKLNQLTDDFNVLLWTIVLSYANQKLSQDGAKEKGWLINRIFFGSLDTTDGSRSFEGHRFCELGVEDRKFQDPRTWFFGVWGEQDDTAVTASYFGNYDASSCASDHSTKQMKPTPSIVTWPSTMLPQAPTKTRRQLPAKTLYNPFTRKRWASHRSSNTFPTK